MSPTVHRTSYQLTPELLHGVLRNAVQAEPSATDKVGSTEGQAPSTLYPLLIDHPIGGPESTDAGELAVSYQRCGFPSRTLTWRPQP